MTTLEHRYRRLLRLYPRDHRRVHEEEMLGVLLAAGPGGQDAGRPDWRDGLDLVAGALKIRLRRLQVVFGPDWSDAFAVLSVIAPLLLLGVSVSGVTFVVNDGASYTIDILTLGNTASAGWALLAVFALLGPRLITAALGCVLAGLSAYVIIVGGDVFVESTADPAMVLVGLLAAIALVASPGPRRGQRLLGRWGCALAATSGAFMVVLNVVINKPDIISDGGRLIFCVLSALAFLPLAPAVLGRSALRRRTTALLGPPLAALLASAVLTKAYLVGDLYPYGDTIPFAVALLAFAVLAGREDLMKLAKIPF